MSEFYASGAGWTCTCGRRNSLNPRNYTYECQSCGLWWCYHCGDIGPNTEDHTCPCPKSDHDCTEHIAWWAT